MNKPFVKYFVDIGLAISFVLVFITGIVKMPWLVRFFIESGWPMLTLAIIHDWSGLFMGILVLIHLILNWDFITAMTKRLFTR